MTTINETFTNAILADATYVHKLQPGESGDDLIRDLKPRMTPVLADYIAQNFSVVTQIESGDNFLTSSGFDATVWRQTGGKLYVSMRGTEFGSDLFIADADLAAIGSARNQLVDMVNWWFRETGAEGADVRQIRLLPIVDMASFVEEKSWQA